MAWEVSSWLALGRSFQVLGAVAAAGLNGFLVAYIYLNKLGLAQNMCILELMICLLLVYITLAIALTHTGTRNKSKGWLITFIVGDALATGITIGIITVLARAGVPSSCGGLTRSNFTGDDRPNFPGAGYTTVRFSDESPGTRGQLDKFCAFERSFYFLTVGLLFLFMITAMLAVLRICEFTYMKRLDNLRGSLSRSDSHDLEKLSSGSHISLAIPKDIMSTPPLLGTPTGRSSSSSMTFGVLAPPSEGIITRQTSIRSASTHNPYRTESLLSGAGGPPRIPSMYALGPSPSARPLIPRRPVARNLSISAISANNTGGSGYAPSVAESSVSGGAAAEAEEALVMDGMMQTHQHRDEQRMPMLTEEDSAEAALVSDGMRHHDGSGRNHQMHHQHSRSLSSGGGRQSMSLLPPYTPGNRMAGHADESNEMRLSDYVKGETRAQAMKDSGRY